LGGAQDAERVECWEGVFPPGNVPSPLGRDLGRGLDPLSRIFLLFDLKMEHFGAVFKLDLTEETRTQLQEEEAIASSCLIQSCQGSLLFPSPPLLYPSLPFPIASLPTTSVPLLPFRSRPLKYS